MTRCLRFVLAASVGLSFCHSVFAAYQDDDDLEELVSRVERETGGRVLSAERRAQDGREMNRIKIYTPEGRVKVMWDDSGRQSRSYLEDVHDLPPLDASRHQAPRR